MPSTGGSRTRWIAKRGFSSWHSPLQSFAWCNNRSGEPWKRPESDGRKHLAADSNGHGVGLEDARHTGSSLALTTTLSATRPGWVQVA